MFEQVLGWINDFSFLTKNDYDQIIYYKNEYEVEILVSL
jgi:hypothetical protein